MKAIKKRSWFTGKRFVTVAICLTLGTLLSCFFTCRPQTQILGTSPNTSDTSGVTINSLAGTDLSVIQNEQSWVNFTVHGGSGKYYEVYQVEGGVNKVLDFGIVGSDNFAVSCQPDTTQLGSYLIYIVISDDSSSVTDIVYLTVSADPAIMIRTLMIYVVGSVAVATNVTAGVMWRKAVKPKSSRTIEPKLLPTSASNKFPTEDDQLYLATSHVVQVLLLQVSPLQILHFEAFKELERPTALHAMIIEKVRDKALEKVKIDNEPLQAFDCTFFLTCLSITNLNLSIVFVTSQGIPPVFISRVKCEVSSLFLKGHRLRNHVEDLARSLIDVLHLNRSFEYDLPVSQKTAILCDDYMWKLPMESQESVDGSSITDFTDDIESMSVNQLQEVLKFLAQKWVEFNNEMDVETETESD
jgi:hypothetical protein